MGGQSTSAGRREGTLVSSQGIELSSLEGRLLMLPLAAGAVLGLLAFLMPEFLGKFGGYPGNDPYIYRLTGAATLGYPVALAFVIRLGNWAAARLVVIGVLFFNLASLYACAYEFLKGRVEGHNVVYVILASSLAFVAITAWTLYSHSGTTQKKEPDIARWLTWIIIVGTLASVVFALLPLFLPGQAASFFGYKGTDVFIYRQAGSACFGYAAMAILGLRSRNWNEFRWPSVAAVVFNGLSFIASVLALLSGDPPLLPILIGVASLAVTVVTMFGIQRNGK